MPIAGRGILGSEMLFIPHGAPSPKFVLPQAGWPQLEPAWLQLLQLEVPSQPQSLIGVHEPEDAHGPPVNEHPVKHRAAVHMAVAINRDRIAQILLKLGPFLRGNF